MYSSQKGFIGMLIIVVISVLVIGGTFLLVSVIYPNVLKDSSISGLTKYFPFKLTTTSPSEAVMSSPVPVFSNKTNGSPAPSPIPVKSYYQLDNSRKGL